MTEDKLGDINFFFLNGIISRRNVLLRMAMGLYRMNLDWDTTTVIPNTNFTGLSIDRNPNFIHIFIILFVVCSVDNDFVKYLVQPRNVGDLAKFHCFGSRVEYPHLRFGRLN